MGTPAITPNAGTDDEYSTPIPQGGTTAPATVSTGTNGTSGPSEDEYSTPIPGAQAGSSTPPAGASTPSAGGSDPLTELHAGIGQGVMSTLGGLATVGDKIGDKLESITGLPASGHGELASILNKEADKFKEEGNGSVASKIGYGGETLAEFMSGDEALKALSMSDRLLATAKTMKIFEKSPRLMQALKIGAEALNAGGRQAAVQGTQTLARSGGDVEQAGKDAAIAGVTGGALHGVFGAAGAALNKGGEAAQTIDDMNNAAHGYDPGAPAPSSVDANDLFKQQTTDSFSKETADAQKELDDSTQQLAKLGDKPASEQDISKHAQAMAKFRYDKLGKDYQEGADQLKEMLGDETVPYEGSALHKVAKSLLDEGDANAGPLDEALRKTRPGSSQANSMLETLADLGKEGEEAKPDTWVDADGKTHTEPGAAAEEAEPATLGIDKLTEYRRLLGERLRNLGWADSNDRADRHIYKSLIQGIDDTIGNLADKSDSPEASDLLKQMNTSYRTGIRLFENNDVDAMLKGNVNNIATRLMRGETSIADIDTVKQTVGAQGFDKIAKDSVGRMVADHIGDDGTLDYKGLFKKWNRINPEVREAMFGKNRNQAISDALTTATGASDKLDDINKSIADILGNGDLTSIMKDPSRLQGLANRVGPDGMKQLGDSVLQNKIAEASSTLDPKTGQITKAKFDPDKVLSWWMEMKDSPEVRDTLFTVDKGKATEYNELMKRLSNASSVKKLVKYGILPLTLGTAGVIHGPGAALVGAIAGLGTEAGFGTARGILDSIANNPRTWAAIKGADNLAKSQGAKILAQATKNAGASGAAALGRQATGYDTDTERRKRLFSGASTALAGGPTPDTHIFNSTQWASHPANKGKDVNEAVAEAKRQGYKVVQ